MSPHAFARFLAASTLLVAGPARAEVLFQNTGHLQMSSAADRRTGWERVYTQQMGAIEVAPSPSFQGREAIRARQTYLASGDGRYHSEVVKFDIQRDGQDLYYGHALYLPPNWQFHADNVTFQQWGLENPGGGAPWILMFVFNDELRVAGVRRAGFGTHVIANIAELRGSWIRVVTRLDMRAPGNFEVWVNGTRRLSLTPANLTGDGDPPTIRWAAGIYCTEWVNQAPLGQRTLELLHDHFRIATSYAEAEPANWREDGGPSSDAGSGVGQDGGSGADTGADTIAGDAATDAFAVDAADAVIAVDAARDAMVDATAADVRRDTASPRADAARPAGDDISRAGGCGCHVRAPVPGHGAILSLLMIAVFALLTRRERRSK